jgi:hypothetical protein
MPRLSRRNVHRGGKRRRRSGGMDPSSTPSSLPSQPGAEFKAAPAVQPAAAQPTLDLGQDKCAQQQKALDNCRNGIAAPSAFKGMTGMMSGIFGSKSPPKGGRKSRRRSGRKSRRRRGGKSRRGGGKYAEFTINGGRKSRRRRGRKSRRMSRR